MKYRRIFIPAVLIVTMLVLFVPGTVFAPQPAAAGSGPSPWPVQYYGSCDMAQFVADITVPDGTYFSPGAAFTKTWRIENLSSCTWTTSYSMIFVSGNLMGAPSVVYFPTSVAPGATVDLSANMIAPWTVGHYFGYWKLRDDAGLIFGVGPLYRTTFYVDIHVGSPVNYTPYWRYGPPPGYSYLPRPPQSFPDGVCKPGYWVGYYPYPPYTWLGYCAYPYWQP
ncbi:MAG: NBR1-Ig-like domain-containing protein [Anaerolineales bacterium]